MVDVQLGSLPEGEGKMTFVQERPKRFTGKVRVLGLTLLLFLVWGALYGLAYLADYYKYNWNGGIIIAGVIAVIAYVIAVRQKK